MCISALFLLIVLAFWKDLAILFLHAFEEEFWKQKNFGSSTILSDTMNKNSSRVNLHS